MAGWIGVDLDGTLATYDADGAVLSTLARPFTRWFAG